MRDRFIHHIALTTGHTRRSYRDEVADDVISTCRALLAEAMKGKVEIPGTGGCLMAATSSPKAALVNVMSPSHEPILTFGIARHSQGGASLWRLLIELAQTPIVAMDCPPEPWCAVRLEPSALKYQAILPMLADFERCIAWSWLDKKKDAAAESSLARDRD